MAHSDRFEKFIPFIFEAETVFKRGHYGDYAYVATEHDPNDAGGTTRFGIDKSSHPDVDVERLTKDQARDIYLREWQAEGIDQLPVPFGECFFDCCVNAGLGRARRIRSKTGDDAAAFLDEREAFYRRLAAAVARDREYLRGWLARIANLRAFLKI